ncbi:MAG: hypothetical protein AB7G17_11110 [Phycisphaerales bacterium]
MRGLLIASAGLAVAAAATARPVYSNGPLSTGATLSTGAAAPAGSTWSEVQLGNTIAGFGSQGGTVGNRMADDFTITDAAGWMISNIRFFGYQTGGSTASSSFTGLNFQIWNGRPGDVGSTVVFGDLTTNRLTGSSWSNMYRTFNGSNNTTRPIYNLDNGGLNVTLGPGTYWLDWTVTGSLASGPWAPAVTVVGQQTVPGANGRQFIGSTGVWGDALDGPAPASIVQQLPFEITYVVPTPGAAALLGMAGFAGLRRRR